MDAGPVALVCTLEIAEQEDTASLTQRLAPLAADAIVAAVDQIAAGEIQWSPQDHSAATFAPKLERQDAILDWRQGSRPLWFRIRALAPKPGATTTLDGQPLRILSARPHAPDALEEDSPAVPGRVRTGHSPALCVATGDGWLEVLRVQRAGGKPLDSAAFLRGHPIAEGSVLGAATEEG
jgi:methionyl-tRNA formyltransferase